MDSRRISVLHLIKCLDRGGAEKLIATMVASGDRTKFDYQVAFARSDMRRMVPEFIAGGTTVHDLGAASDFDLRWALRLRRLLNDQHFDVLHTHLPYTAALGRLVARSLPRGSRPRLVYTEHSRHDRNNRVSRLLRHLTGRLDDVSIAVAETNRQALPKALRERSRVVVHGVALDTIVPSRDRATVRAALGVAPDRLLVVSVANLTHQKGYHTLLQAADRLVSAGLPVVFVAAGAGPLEADLRAMRDRLGLQRSFHFLGQRDDAVDLISAADVMVLSSAWECMPVVVMEAFAVGTPVVATATGDLPQVIDSGRNGLLVAPDDPEALAEGLEQVLSKPALRDTLGRGAAESAAVFDARRSTSEIEAIYAELVRA